MYTCTLACMHICFCSYRYGHVYVCTCLCEYVSIHSSVYTCMYVCVRRQPHLFCFLFSVSQPENVLLTADGHLKLVDFGSAKLLRPLDGVTAGADQDGEHILLLLPTDLLPILPSLTSFAFRVFRFISTSTSTSVSRMRASASTA